MKWTEKQTVVWPTARVKAEGMKFSTEEFIEALTAFGLGVSAVFWYGVLRAMGQCPSFATAIRAYYLGQMGKYLPGKAWALFLRAALIRGPAHENKRRLKLRAATLFIAASLLRKTLCCLVDVDGGAP